MARIVAPKCHVCGKSAVVEVTENQFWTYTHQAELGVHIQTIFPDWTPDERELLITGTHAECWEKIFGSQDDDE